VPALSAVVYRLDGRIPRSKSAPSIALREPAPAAQSRGRMEVRADVAGDSFYEVTFQADTGRGWKSIGTDDNAPYRVFHDVKPLRAGTDVRYRAIVLDNRGRTRSSAVRAADVPAPRVTIDVPVEGAKVRGDVLVRAFVDPERGTHVVTFERSVAGGPWTAIGSDDSSPAYVVTDDIAGLGLATGTPIRYRATVTEPDGTRSTSAVRNVEQGPPPIETAVLRYLRPAGDYGQWGLHMWGEAVRPDVLAQIAWDRPWQRAGVENGWARYEIPLIDDTKPVNFIMHLPSGDSVPDTREPGGDRSFIPLNSPEVWIKQGDPTVYTSQPGTG
jgi:alpha-amylase